MNEERHACCSGCTAEGHCTHGIQPAVTKPETPDWCGLIGSFMGVPQYCGEPATSAWHQPGEWFKHEFVPLTLTPVWPEAAALAARPAEAQAGAGIDVAPLRVSERYAAENILNRRYADPDDDAAIVARALLRLTPQPGEPTDE